MLHGDDHFSRGHVTFTLPVPEMPGPGPRQAGQKSLTPVSQGGCWNLKNRCCIGGPGSWVAPGGAPWGKVCGLHRVGSEAVLPPMVAAFLAPVCGKAGKDKIKSLNRRGQTTVW